MRAQLASPEQLRSLFPPVVDDEYKEMEMNEDDVSELDDAGDLLYDGGGGVSILVSAAIDMGQKRSITDAGLDRVAKRASVHGSSGSQHHRHG